MYYIQNISRKISINYHDTNFMKGISTLIGAVLINFLVGAIYSLCTLAVYEISYIKGRGGSIEIEHLTFYYPIEIFFQCISAFTSGFIYKKIGLHRTNFIGVSILSFGYYMMYLSSNLLMDIFSIILGGIGTGIILYPSTTNSYEWFPEHNGIIVGIMETSISLGSFFFAFIGEKIVNRKEIPSHDSDNLYDFDIGKRIKIYLLVQIISLISIFLLSLILMYEKVKKYQIDNNTRIKNDDNEKETFENLEDKDNDITNFEKLKKINEKIGIGINLNINGNNEITPIKEDSPERLVKFVLNKNKLNKKGHIQNNFNESKTDSIKKILKIAMRSNRLLLFSIIVILEAPVSNMAFTLYREIGEYEKINIKYLQLIGSLYFIFECLSSLVFGILCDYIKLKNLLLLINGVGTIIGLTYCLTFKFGFIFFLVQNILSFSAGGYYPVKDCFLMQVFGKDIYIELSGFVSFVVALTVNIITPITYIVLSNLENKELAYWILFLSFGSLNLIGFILNFFLDESPIDLEKLAKDENKNAYKI